MYVLCGIITRGLARLPPTHPRSTDPLLEPPPRTRVRTLIVSATISPLSETHSFLFDRFDAASRVEELHGGAGVRAGAGAEEREGMGGVEQE